MENIQLDTRDRRNIYREDADNVHALGIEAEGDVDVAEIEQEIEDTATKLIQAGGRRAYVVIRIER